MAYQSVLGTRRKVLHERAPTDFREAVALAQRMGAKAYELRATMSLARLLASQGRRGEARTMLAAIYGWFTDPSADMSAAGGRLQAAGGRLQEASEPYQPDP